MVLVDRNDYHQFQPLLYQVATSQLPAEDIARPHRTIFADYPTVDGRHRARGRGRRWPTARCSSPTGRPLTGSHLVLAAGARPNFFGVPGAAEHAFPLYSVADAERLRLHLQDSCRRPWPAAVPAEDDGAPRRRGRRRRTDRGRDHRRLGRADAGVAEHRPLDPVGTDHHRRPRHRRCSGSSPARPTTYALDKLTEARSRRQARGRRHRRPPRSGRVRRRDHDPGPHRGVGRWGVGLGRRADTGPVLGRGGRIDVRPDLTVEGYPGVYAVGDVANIPSGTGDAPTLPQLGSVAQQSGAWAAENILRELRGIDRRSPSATRTRASWR